MLLVTGACGYIGSHFVRYYLERHPDEQVACVDNLSEGHRQALSGPHGDRVRFYQCDIGNRGEMRRVMQTCGVDSIVHFAASAYVGESQQKPFKYFDNNVGATTGLLDAMVDCGVRKLVFSSTCATYGVPRYSPLDEKHPQKPINTYGVTKLMVEEMLRALALCAGLRYVCLRYFNASGAHADCDIGESHAPETHLLPLALQAALGTGPALTIYGDDYDTPDGTCVRDYIHVSDLAKAHVQALEYMACERWSGDIEASGGEGLAINLGTARGASVREVIKAVEVVSGRPVPHSFGPRRAGDPPHLVANADKARKILGWKPDYDLNAIVRSAYEWELNRQY